MAIFSPRVKRARSLKMHFGGGVTKLQKPVGHPSTGGHTPLFTTHDPGLLFFAFSQPTGSYKWSFLKPGLSGNLQHATQKTHATREVYPSERHHGVDDARMTGSYKRSFPNRVLVGKTTQKRTGSPNESFLLGLI